ncbi:MAG: Z1 domain-containing protein [Anaerolineae bacterium]
MSTDWVYRQFLNSRLLPSDQKKELLEGGFDEEVIESALKKFYERTGQVRQLTPPHMLVEERATSEGWYPGASELPGARFWPALRNHLIESKGWTEEAVVSIDKASDKIVGWLQSPWAPRIDSRGLVVGYVQSGKTANFTAVIAKAADAGYRFFIVLSGTKKSLRRQTQARLSKELVSLNDDVWYTPTAEHDFRPLGNVNFFLSDKKHDKVLCVVKKNSIILQKLRNWLQGASSDLLRECPFLVIDDEADEASINTARGQVDTPGDSRDRSAINRHLVQLLQLLPKAAYVGYTATPFANVFIDPTYEADLYPKDFIVALPKPDGHFGTERIFGRERLRDDDTDEEFEGLNMVRRIPDEEIEHLRPGGRKEGFVLTVTPSLEEAINYFWLTCAARMVRGQVNEHMTMLVHTSQLIHVHNTAVHQIERYRQSILQMSQPDEIDNYGEYLRLLWEREQAAVPSNEFNLDPVQFYELGDFLPVVIDNTIVVADNSQSTSRLTYDDGPRIQIAVGGNTLSRGLTLEGLAVSFFVRSASTYDTLLQMGRWFGYRPSYGDLPRIWMTRKLEEYFRTLATVEAEIRQDIAVYDLEKKTPKQFGVRIRTHPDLNITAPLKMQHAVKAQVSFDDTVQQTVLFNHNQPDWLLNNINAVSQLINDLERQGLVLENREPHRFFYNAPADSVVQFIRNYAFHENNRALQSAHLIGYINDQRHYGLLERWNIVIRGLTSKQADMRRQIQLGRHHFPLLVRARRDYDLRHAHIGVLMSRGDVGADLLKTPLTNIQEMESTAIKKLRGKEFPDVGLLIIYPIDKDSKPTNSGSKKIVLGAAEHVMGMGIVFPPAKEYSRGAQDYMTVNLAQIDDDQFVSEEEEQETDDA